MEKYLIQLMLLSYSMEQKQSDQSKMETQAAILGQEHTPEKL